MTNTPSMYRMTYLDLYVFLQALMWSLAAGSAMNLTAAEACAGFDHHSDGPVSPWELIECMEVWNNWTNTIKEGFHIGYPDGVVLQELSKALRERGSPCILHETETLDGMGSAMIRHMASWLYAKEVGCDWIAPDFHQGNVTALYYADEDSVPLYCHRTENFVGFDPQKPLYGGKEPRRCATVSWINYFHMTKFSIVHPKGQKIHTVKVSHSDATPIKEVVDDTLRVGLDNVGWDLLQLLVHPQEAVHIAAVTGSWNAVKREHARNLLNDFRDGFHESPRLGYTTPTCPYESSRLNFALHIRLGDRGFGRLHEYLEMIQNVMETITKEVEAEGQPSPLFHVFSETKDGCPSETSGTFHEFPTWTLEPDEIRECVDAEVPVDCPEKQAGGDFCFPIRSGVFHVIGSPIVLNLGTGVMNSFACMTEADGILMGCSCFGLAAGILNKGIKLFSVSCKGPSTWEQNQIGPPLAVAEQGEMWVPIVGSWHDPVLEKRNIFKNVLRRYLAEKGLLD